MQKRIETRAKYSGMTESPSQYIFACEKNGEGNSRYDFIAYCQAQADERKDSGANENERLKYGHVKAIVRPNSKSSKKATALIIHKMIEVTPEDGNKKVVEKYGMKRLGYALTSENHIAIEVIPLQFVHFRTCIVPDMHWMTRQHGVKKRLSTPLDTVADRENARFFAIPRKASSFACIS